MSKHESMLHSCFGLNIIPLDGHILFTHSSVDGQLGYFQCLVPVSNATMKMCVSLIFLFLRSVSSTLNPIHHIFLSQTLEFLISQIFM